MLKKNMEIKFANLASGNVFYLPFLGEKIELDSELKDEYLSCTIPTVEKGGVVWVE